MNIRTLSVAAAISACFATAPISLAGQEASIPGPQTSVVVTLEPKHGRTIPPVELQDITVSQGRDKRPVAGLTPFGPGQGSLQLLLLIDDSARGTFDTELGTLKQFINALPPDSEVGVAYMRNGFADFTQNFTRDHAAAARSIRVAFGAGGGDVSPYDSLTDAARKWPNPGAQRKEVVMISSGIEGLGGGFAPDNPYVNAGISSAQKAGIVVDTIYSPSVGHEGHSFFRANWGQNFLSQLSDQTGGESYINGFGSPVSFQPFLEEVLERLQHQYLLTFEAHPESKSGLQPVKIRVTEKDASIAAPDKVFVKAST